MPVGSKYNLVFAASEVAGFAKTGGLADVAASLPRALAERGHQCTVFMPLYRSARTGPIPLLTTQHFFTIPLGTRSVPGSLWQAKLPGSGVSVYLVEQPEFFERDDILQGRGIYQFTLPNGQKQDYPDNCARYTFFCRAVLEGLRLLDYWPDVVHANDWHTGLLPVYVREEYSRRGIPAFRERYRRIRTVFTVHNLAYQGVFWHWDLPLTGLDWPLFNYGQLEFYGRLNFLKAGIVFSDLITTVSPRYAQEIQTPYFGCGLEGVLREHGSRLYGIVNGVDYQEWDPAHDPRLAANYDSITVVEGKARCKAALQRQLGLAEEPRTPLLGMVTRLVEQKGVHLVAKVAGTLIQQEGVQLAILGEGDPVYQRQLLDVQAQYPHQVSLTLGFDEPLAHQIEAGADMFLMPSLFEPSGLNQLYSLKYGTVPVVRSTGGLADTIVSCTPETLAEGKATGFTFLAQTSAALIEAVREGLKLFKDQPVLWVQLVRNGMRQDWSWNRSAQEYERLYARVLGGGNNEIRSPAEGRQNP